jgi:Tat protein translocase TatB subunit
MEILIVGILALMVFGPDKLPDMARSVGRFMKQVKAMASEAKSEFDISADARDDKKTVSGPEHVKTSDDNGVPSGPVEDASEAPAFKATASADEAGASDARPSESTEQILASR